MDSLTSSNKSSVVWRPLLSNLRCIQVPLTEVPSVLNLYTFDITSPGELINNSKIFSTTLNTPANQAQPTFTRFTPNLESIQNALKYDKKLHYPSISEFEKFIQHSIKNGVQLNSKWLAMDKWEPYLAAARKHFSKTQVILCNWHRDAKELQAAIRITNLAVAETIVSYFRRYWFGDWVEIDQNTWNVFRFGTNVDTQDTTAKLEDTDEESNSIDNTKQQTKTLCFTHRSGKFACPCGFNVNKETTSFQPKDSYGNIVIFTMPYRGKRGTLYLTSTCPVDTSLTLIQGVFTHKEIYNQATAFTLADQNSYTHLLLKVYDLMKQKKWVEAKLLWVENLLLYTKLAKTDQIDLFGGLSERFFEQFFHDSLDQNLLVTKSTIMSTCNSDYCPKKVSHPTDSYDIILIKAQASALPGDNYFETCLKNWQKPYLLSCGAEFKTMNEEESIDIPKNAFKIDKYTSVETY
ncbi:hypothetical protein C2G38_2147582 [Gigaspora rosea]|uniref:Uncharacterized protein n=1 Tax=Gigaspora rosea TaxID=44941 RepID=A0A397UAU6_9GLOM|nr:hypothetical protein C2G38_2147582 [Gigaspora rosea]